MKIRLDADKLEMELYKNARYYPGFYQEIAEDAHVRADALYQALNPNYHERPSFITRTAKVLRAWKKRHPRKGNEAVRIFIEYITGEAPSEEAIDKLLNARRQLQAIRDDLESITRHVKHRPHHARAKSQSMEAK